jgi:hypothetical protein
LYALELNRNLAAHSPWQRQVAGGRREILRSGRSEAQVGQLVEKSNDSELGKVMPQFRTAVIKREAAAKMFGLDKCAHLWYGKMDRIREGAWQSLLKLAHH